MEVLPAPDGAVTRIILLYCLLMLLEGILEYEIYNMHLTTPINLVTNQLITATSTTNQNLTAW